MAKFSFRLQSVLNLKTALENQQKNAFSAAKKRLDDEEEKLGILKQRLYEYEEEGRSLRENVLQVQDLLDNRVYITRINEYIDEQTLAVKLAENRLEEERVKLVEMMRERKTYERLKEKAFEQYIEEEKHAEAVENDEHNSYVYSIKEA